MIMTVADARTRLLDYIDTPGVDPMFIVGDAAMVLRSLPSNVFDCCMTSPPYWGKREYAEDGIGLENHYRDFIDNLVAVCAEIKRVLRPTGSFWLNIGDSYYRKKLVGIPWRVRNVHEHILHFVAKPRGYFYDADAIRSTPKTTKVVNGTVVSATGVRGVRYKRQIQLSTELTDVERKDAFQALDKMLNRVRNNESPISG